MKRIMLTAVLIFIMLQLQANAGVLCQASAPGNEYTEYKLQAISVSGESVLLLQFILATDCYVTVKVADSDTTQLAEGEMDEGAYNVYYRSSNERSDRTVKCIMEIYRDQSKSEVICKRETILQGK